MSATARYLPKTIDTPCVVVDVATVHANIERAQNRMNVLGLQARPHIKTHKLPQFAQLQLNAGATGITCQKIGEAEIMAAAGINDILITYNILGPEKLARLVALAASSTISVVADSATVIEGLSAAFAAQANPLTVLIECDTGQARCGVQTPEQARELAVMVDQAKGLRFGGLMTYPPKHQPEAVAKFFSQARQLIEADGLAVERISGGGTPGMYQEETGEITEHRAGTYIYNDRSLMMSGDCTEAQCALRVVATVVSRPTADRAIIDAGSKALTSDTMGLDGFGYIAEYPTASIVGLHEEHGVVKLPDDGSPGPKVGEIIHIIPNHVCVVSNLYDVVFLRHEDGTIEQVEVAARGQVW
jgi:D-serine deaminase-like pyridoxal phosphate-dependent protein